MTFSERCGKSIVLTDENKCAKRREGYNYGIVYSKRPLCVELSEIFEVKIEATLEEKWAGSLRIGITSLNPNSEDNDFPDATSVTDSSILESPFYWVCCGLKYFHNNQQFDLKNNFNHLSKLNDTVGIQVRPNGQLHIYHNGIHIEKVLDGMPIDKKLFVLVDIYGGTVRVSCVQKTVESLKNNCRRVIQVLVKEESIDELPIPKDLKIYLRL